LIGEALYSVTLANCCYTYKMDTKLIITTEESYQETMIAIFELMERGEDDLSPAEAEQLKLMTAAAEKYENDYL
jgi:hypothetical protein